MTRIKKNCLAFYHLVVEGVEEAVVMVHLAGGLLDLGRGVDLEEEIHFLQVLETSGLRP